MKTRTVGAAILLPALCLTCLTAVAGTLFDDFGPGNSYQADCAWAVSGPASPIGQFIQANEFTAVASGTVTTINLAISLTELPGHGGGSIWTIGNAGLPGIQLGPSWDFTTSLAFGNCCQIEVIDTPDGPTLSAGTSYLMILQTYDTTFADWNLNLMGVNGVDLFSRDDGKTWISNGDGTIGAFRISSATNVPEPDTLLMLGTGLVGAGATIRRRRRG